MAADESTEALDLAAIRYLRDSTGEVFREIVDLYLKDTPRQIDDLEQAAHAGEVTALRQLAHSIKGSSRSIGAGLLAALCERLERECQGGRVDQALRKVADIRGAFDRAGAALRSFLG